MPYAIATATLTVTSSYAAAPDTSSGSLDLATWGFITLWDIRFWLPWSSRGLVGPGSWQDYLFRFGAVFDSTQAPGYNPVSQAPKSWAYRTDAVPIYDSTVIPGGSYPYKPCSTHGGGPFAYTPDIHATAAFDDSSLAHMLSTLVIAIYGANSYPPLLGGPTATDTLSFYGCYLDITLTAGGGGRYYPQSYVVIAPGSGVGVPTGVVSPGLAVDTDTSGTCAVVQETNGHVGTVGALWHPAVLLLTGWAGTVIYPPPPRNHAFFNAVMAMGRGKNASFTGGW